MLHMRCHKLHMRLCDRVRWFRQDTSGGMIHNTSRGPSMKSRDIEMLVVLKHLSLSKSLCRKNKRDVYLCANHGRADMGNEMKHHKRTQNVLPTNVHMYVQCAIVYSPNKHTHRVGFCSRNVHIVLLMFPPYLLTETF